MNVATTSARLILGAGFIFSGASAFFIASPPPEPGLAGDFNAIFFASHWVLYVAAAQLTLGLLLAINRFVPFALIVLAAFLYNSFAFHATMAPGSLWAPVLVFALALPLVLQYREAFAAVFAAKPAVRQPVPAAMPRGA